MTIESNILIVDAQNGSSLPRVSILLIVSLWLCPTSLNAADQTQNQPSAGFKATVKPFLNSYCIDCHGPKKHKGDRRFDRLTSEILDDSTLVDFQDILDQLNLSEMPPGDAKQPSIEQRRAAIVWITTRIARYHRERKTDTGRVVLRRLNSREYRNTVRDLLHVNITMFDPTAMFPRDQTTAQLDNVGESLVTSGHLLARYLAAAEQIVDKAMSPLTKPDVQTWTFRDNFHQQPEIDQVHRKTNKFKHMTLYDVVGADKPEGAYGPIHAFKQGVPTDGYYEIRLRAEALNRINPYEPEFLGMDPDEPFRLGIVAGNYRVGNLHLHQPIEPLLAEFELADESRWYTVRVWLDAGYTPRFTFRNGLMDIRNLYARILKKYPDLFPTPRRKGIVENRLISLRDGKLPQIRIHEIEITGPHYDEWPTAGQQAILGDDWEHVVESGELPDEVMRRHLTRFASRAYRRPVDSNSIDHIMSVINTRRKSGRSSLEAYGDGLKAVLCSPHFLYLEQDDEKGKLSATALASRLSYLLWSSTPDEELSRIATNGDLLKTEFLIQQVDRMLENPKSDAFVDGFLGSWLTLRDLGATPPDRDQFRAFYHYDLDSAMRQETRLFTRYLIDENLSIVNFLDSDFTFVNKPLARLYKLQPPSGTGFEKVSLTDKRRGGLLGQASILTVTANGIDTSPVVRGVWLLENILGTPPSPPPPDVEPLDPDIRGAKTIRDQLSKHRDIPSCADCHRKIDPLGFALENFDPIGGWRDSYGRKTEIDAAGELPGGMSFNNIADLKKILVEHQSEQFGRALTEKLLAYAIGRNIEPTDRPQVDAILTDLNKSGRGFRDLIHLVILSDLFRKS
jgi:hypothetical protein